MNYLESGFRIVLIAAAGYAIYRLLNFVIDRLRDNQYLSRHYAILAGGGARWGILIITVLMILQELGIEASYILAAASTVLVLIAVGFVALWSVLSNILCSFLLLLFPPFRFGDVIELKDPDKEKGIKGTVSGLNMFYTCLEPVDESGDEQLAGTQLIRVPNTLFFQRIIIGHAGTDTQDLKLKPVSEKQNAPKS